MVSFYDFPKVHGAPLGFLRISQGLLGGPWTSLGGTLAFIVNPGVHSGPSGVPLGLQVGSPVILGRSWGELVDRPGGTEKTEDSPSEGDLGEPLGCFWSTQVGLWSAEGGTNVDISCLLQNVLVE